MLLIRWEINKSERIEILRFFPTFFRYKKRKSCFHDSQKSQGFRLNTKKICTKNKINLFERVIIDKGVGLFIVTLWKKNSIVIRNFFHKVIVQHHCQKTSNMESSPAELVSKNGI